MGWNLRRRPRTDAEHAAAADARADEAERVVEADVRERARSVRAKLQSEAEVLSSIKRRGFWWPGE